jgi:hypothetical protein
MADNERASDALDTLVRQGEILSELVATWSDATHKLMDHDSVQVRWERGSAVKFILQHAAVREQAKERVVERLREAGADELAGALEGDAASRRGEIGRLDEEARGHQAISLNNPEVDIVVEQVVSRLRKELDTEAAQVAEVVKVLGGPEERNLPSDRAVRTQSLLHLSPEPKWYERAGALRALKAFYDHLRSSPNDITSPAVDEGREYQPGPK